MKKFSLNLNSTILLAVLVSTTFCCAVTSAQAQFFDPMTLAPTWAQKRSDSLIPEFREATWLVQAEVVEVTDDQGESAAKLQIRDVFCGPSHLLAERFGALSLKEVFDMHGYMFSPPLTLHEKGVFAISYRPARRGEQSPYQWMYVSTWRYGMELPVREKDAEYEDAKKQAVLLQKLCNLPPAEQITMMKSYAANEYEPIVGWAINALSVNNVEGLDAFLKQLLSNPKFTRGGQIASDAILVKSKDMGWVGTDQRFKLLEQWVTDTGSYKNDKWVLDRLAESFREKSIDGDQYFKLLKIALVNNHKALSWKRDVIESLSKLPKDYPVAQKEVFGLLIQEYQSNEDLKLSTAMRFENLMPLAPEQKAIVLGLVDAATNPYIKGFLQASTHN